MYEPDATARLINKSASPATSSANHADTVRRMAAGAASTRGLAQKVAGMAGDGSGKRLEVVVLARGGLCFGRKGHRPHRILTRKLSQACRVQAAAYFNGGRPIRRRRSANRGSLRTRSKAQIHPNCGRPLGPHGVGLLEIAKRLLRLSELRVEGRDDHYVAAGSRP